jgi:hypothetical protein
MAADRLPTVSFTTYDEVEEPTVDELWPEYLRAFAPLRTKAAARMVMHRHEFAAQMADRRIVKYLARCGDELAAVGTMARELEAVDWISPDFYAARFPERYAAKRIYCLGWMFVVPQFQHRQLRLRLLEHQAERIIADGAMLVYDTCRFNEDELAFTAGVNARLAELDLGAIPHPLDEQLYYAWVPFSKSL